MSHWDKLYEHQTGQEKKNPQLSKIFSHLQVWP